MLTLRALSSGVEHCIDIARVRGAKPLVPTTIMYLGAHTSIAGSFDKCLDRISDLGGNCLMTFASSPRSLTTKDLPQKTIDIYLAKKNKLNIGPHFFHGVYLINLASEKKSYLKVSIDSLIFYQQLAGAIGGVGTIFHIGSHKGLGLPEVIDQVVQAINEVLDNTPKGTRLFLENAAGAAGTIGSTFEELAGIMARIGDKSKIGICLDTQHAWASGYTLDTVLAKFDQVIGLKYLRVIHLNDSKTDFESHVDRHENLGKGKIGKDALQAFINDKRLANIPFILEVPGRGEGPTKSDLDSLKKMIL